MPPARERAVHPSMRWSNCLHGKVQRLHSVLRLQFPSNLTSGIKRYASRCPESLFGRRSVQDMSILSTILMSTRHSSDRLRGRAWLLTFSEKVKIKQMLSDH